jgi:hypothetical protein
VTYVNKRGERSTLPLNQALESSNAEMTKRLKYTKDILTHMLNNNTHATTTNRNGSVGPGAGTPHSQTSLGQQNIHPLNNPGVSKRNEMLTTLSSAGLQHGSQTSLPVTNAGTEYQAPHSSAGIGSHRRPLNIIN